MDKEVDTTSNQEQEISQTEEKARSLGWRPKEEYEGEKRWVDADEFVERAELYDGIHKANRKAKKMEKVIETLMVHNREIEKAALQKALEALRQEKVEAAKDNDVSKVVLVDEKIDEIKEKLTTTKADNPPASDTEEILAEWKSENSWFDESSPEFDEDMQAYANGLGSKLENQNPDWSSDKILSEVAKRTKKAFEWKFKNKNRETPNKVSGVGGKGKSGTSHEKKITYDDLPLEAKEMYRTLVKTNTNPYGVMSADEYLADYAIASVRKNGSK